MRAHLILKPAGGDVGTEELPTAATIKSRLASAETVRKAEEAARQLGFTVVSTTPLQVTIEGAKEQFEKAFSSRLQPAGPEGKQAGGKRPATRKSSRKHSAEMVVGAERYHWERAPRVPAEMEDAVKDIVLPQVSALH